MKSILKDPILKKGTVIGWDWFFVIVQVRASGWLDCICDNANNVYSFNIKEIAAETIPNEWVIIQPEEADQIPYFGKEYEDLMARGLPFRVIAEVLSGEHDCRFNNYELSEAMK